MRWDGMISTLERRFRRHTSCNHLRKGDNELAAAPTSPAPGMPPAAVQKLSKASRELLAMRLCRSCRRRQGSYLQGRSGKFTEHTAGAYEPEPGGNNAGQGCVTDHAHTRARPKGAPFTRRPSWPQESEIDWMARRKTGRSTELRLEQQGRSQRH